MVLTCIYLLQIITTLIYCINRFLSIDFYHCFIAFVTDSQQRYENELLQLREKLVTIQDDDSCHLELQNNEIPRSGDSLENGKHKNDSGQTVNSGGQSETAEHRFQEILNRELSVFCEKMCSSRTGDVSNEQETNARHEVAEGYEGNNEQSADDSEVDSKDSGDCSSNVDSDGTLSSQDLIKEVDSLKRKLAGDLIPLLSSNEGNILFLQPNSQLV